MSYGPRTQVWGVRLGVLASLNFVALSSHANVTLDSVYTNPSYIEHNGGSGTASTNIATKLVGSEIGSFAYYGGATNNNTAGAPATISWTGATGGNGTIPSGNDSAVWRSANCVQNVESGVQSVIQIGTSVQKLRVYFGGFGPPGCKCRVALNDGSGLSDTRAVSGGVCVANYRFVEWTLNANAVGQTATISIFANDITQAGGQIFYGAVVLGT